MARLVAATLKYRHCRASVLAVVTIAGRVNYLGPLKSKASRLIITALSAKSRQRSGAG